MPAVMYIVYVTVHLLITLMLTLTTSVHISAYTHTHTHTHTHHTEPTLIVDNLTAVLDSVQGNMRSVIVWLQISFFQKSELQQQYDRGQVNRVYAEYFISNNPCPSWTIVANALWILYEAGALEMIQKLYLKGEPCVHLCRIEGRMSASEFCNER